MFIQIDSKDREPSSVSESDMQINMSACRALYRGEGLIRFKSCTFSYSFHQINQKNNTFIARFSNATFKTINILGTLTSGNLSATNMTANIKAQMDVNSAGQIFTVSVSQLTGKLNISANVGNFIIETIDNDCGEVIGQLKNTSSTSANTYEGKFVVNLTPVKHLYISTNFSTKTGNFDSLNQSMNSIFCKVPVVTAYFSNIHYEESQSEFRHIGELPSMLKIRVTDNKGQIVDFNGVPYQIEFEYKNEYNNKNN